jgi:RimJ/RimL family protein N-acetyltransferase
MDYFDQETERLIFRRLTMEDVPSWTEFFVDNDRLHFVWIGRQLERYEESGLGMLAITDRSSGELIGLSGIIPREVDDSSYLEIAYSFKPRVWGKGYATETVKQLKHFGFSSGLSDQFISIIDLDNYASQAVAQKNGMEILKRTNYMDMEVFIFAVTK